MDASRLHPLPYKLNIACSKGGNGSSTSHGDPQPQSSQNLPIPGPSHKSSDDESTHPESTTSSSKPRKRKHSSSTATESEHAEEKQSSATLTASETERLLISQSPELMKTPTKKRKVLNKRYVGDWSSEATISPRKRKIQLQMMKNTINVLRRKNKLLLEKNRRLKSRVVCMSSLLKYLKNNKYLSENAVSVLKTTQPDESGEIIKKFLAGPSKAKYTPVLRSFALTLNFYSPKAYNFIRAKFNKSLPHPRTISKWYKSVDGSPGSTEEARKALSMKVSAANSKGKKVLCNFVLDEVAIKKSIQWDGKNFSGYVNFGTGLDSDELAPAKEALVFMLVAVNDRWKVPIGYFLLDGLSSLEKTNLVQKGLEFVHSTGVVVTSVTFDGAATNISMIRHLNADISNYLQMRTWFLHPITGEKIFIYLDACHMLKLLRNCLGTFRQLVTDTGEIIDWKYIEELVKLQDEEGLHMGTKIRQRHLHWEDQPMKVNLAAQTFSRSVADSLRSLEHDYKLEAFQGATAEFINTVNDLFDIFNSKNKFCKVNLRKALSKDNREQVFLRLSEIKTYLCSLKLTNNLSVLECRRKTGFQGFLICIESLLGFFREFVEEKQYLEYILTYKLSQDHIELFFCALRSRLGLNNNPTAREFERCYKRLIVHTEIRPSVSGNAIALDSTSILHCSSVNTITRNNHASDTQEEEDNIKSITEYIADHDYITPKSWALTDYTKDVISYIAGFVVKSVKRILTCDECLHILIGDKVLSQLQQRKTYGKLFIPSEYTVKLCQESEKIVRFLKAQDQLFLQNDQTIDKIINSTIADLPQDLFKPFGNHVFDGELWDNHSGELTRLVMKKYIHVRFYHESKQESYRRTLRKKLNKIILFRNE